MPVWVRRAGFNRRDDAHRFVLKIDLRYLEAIAGDVATKLAAATWPVI